MDSAASRRRAPSRITSRTGTSFQTTKTESDRGGKVTGDEIHRPLILYKNPTTKLAPLQEYGSIMRPGDRRRRNVFLGVRLCTWFVPLLITACADIIGLSDVPPATDLAGSSQGGGHPSGAGGSLSSGGDATGAGGSAGASGTAGAASGGEGGLLPSDGGTLDIENRDVGPPDAPDACVVNACGGCGRLSGALGAACGTCGTYVCRLDKSDVICSDTGLNACGGCGTLPAAPNSACGSCGHYVCSADKTAVSCQDPGSLSVKQVVTGGFYTCVVLSNGGVRCWGQNNLGQLGDGANSDRSALPLINVLTGVTSMTAGLNHACAVRAGALRCWGLNVSGQLGDGTTTNRNTPGANDILIGVSSVSAGYAHTCVRMDSGGLRCWGDNSSGELGDGNHPNTNSPPSTELLAPTAMGVSAGGAYTCALVNVSAVIGVRCWGSNALGSLGDGAAVGRATPPVIDVLTHVRSVCVGAGGQTCAVLDSGGLRCWGSNNHGQLGDGTTTDRAVPPASDVLTGVTAVACGNSHTCALLASGGVRCWGRNNAGELGDGTTLERTSPPTSDLLTNVASIAAGWDHSCAVLNTGELRCWGGDFYGQLGDGATMVDRSFPVAPMGNFCP